MKKIEDNSIEYKAEFPSDINDLKAEIVSFLNSNKPGTIYLGATDSGEVIQFASPEEKSNVYKSWEERLANWINDAFYPEVRGLIELYPNESPFRIHVFPGNEKPYYFTKGFGINVKGIYVRVGSTKRLASDDEFRAMVNKSARASYETFDSNFSDLTFISYISKLTPQDKQFDENSLRLKPLITTIWLA